MEENLNVLNEEKLNSLIKTIEEMKVSDLVKFSKAIAERFGISLDAVSSSSSSGESGDNSSESSAPKTFKLVIKGFTPDKKIQVLKSVKDALALSISDAKKIVDAVESQGEMEIKRGLKAEEAKKLVDLIQAAGATLEQSAE